MKQKWEVCSKMNTSGSRIRLIFCKTSWPSIKFSEHLLNLILNVLQHEFSKQSLPEANMWKPCEILCEKKINFTHCFIPFSHLFTCISHVFHIIFSHACEIILCERHVKHIWKSMWNHVILLTYFFTCNFTHFSARFIGRNFTYFSHASSLRSSHTFHMQFHTLWQIKYSI